MLEITVNLWAEGRCQGRPEHAQDLAGERQWDVSKVADSSSRTSAIYKVDLVVQVALVPAVGFIFFLKHLLNGTGTVVLPVRRF